MPENLGGYIGLAVTIVWFVGTLIWFFRRQYGRAKKVSATVVNKQITDSFSKYSGNGKGKVHYVTFLAGGKRRCFKVSAFSYNGYRVGESGTLTYKGDRLIDFS